MKLFLFSITFFLLVSCKNNKTPLFAKDLKNEKERNNNLLVFVAKPISWEYLPRDSTSMDEGFKAKCKIIQPVYGEYKNETIEFESYDHYGLPAFLRYKYVLLFLRKIEGKYYQVKYQFNNVYRTKNGRWAGVYNCIDKPYNDDIKPEKIEFEDTVCFPSIYKDIFGDNVDFPCGEPYYKLVSSKKIPVYGNYVEELFKTKKEGVLSDRGFFGSKAENETLEITETPMEEVKIQTPKHDDLVFNKSYHALLESINKIKLKEFKLLVSDTLKIFDSLIITKSLTDTSFKYFFKQKILKKYNNFFDLKNLTPRYIDTTKFSITTLKNKVKALQKGNSRILIMSYNFDNKNSKKIALQFLRTNKGFKLKSYEHINFPMETYYIDGFYLP